MTDSEKKEPIRKRGSVPPPIRRNVNDSAENLPPRKPVKDTPPPKNEKFNKLDE